MLLGGLSTQPQKLYEKAIKAAKKNLFFRPMNEEEKDILIPGFVRADNGNVVLEPQGQHLGCFVGGMMGISSKLFNEGEDLEVARKLVDGCIWVYDSMRMGIMPETFHVVQCQKEKCPWDVWDWYEEIFKKVEGVGLKNIEQKIREYRLKPGFVDFPDRRYILRFVP
jgi:mannosyl-oligosaccharide alpha-1,2-mannosidase